MRRTISIAAGLVCVVAVAAGCRTESAGGSLDSRSPEATTPTTSPTLPDDAGTPNTASSPAPTQTLISSCIDDLDRVAQTDASVEIEQETLETCNAVVVAWGRSRRPLWSSMSALKPDAPAPIREALGENLGDFRDRWNEIASTTAGATQGTMASCIAALTAFEESSDPTSADGVEATESCAVAMDNADAAAFALAVVCEALALGPDRRAADRLTGDIESFLAAWSLVAG